jgi:sugar PTS system EIIA component
MTIVVGSPVSGRVVPMSEVPDPLFAQAIVGPGRAVLPGAAGDAVAPVDGRVATLHPHAFVIATEQGPAVLVHLGIDTMKLGGAGFTLHVSKGDTVTAGQPIVGWDPAEVERAGYSAVCPVVALDTAEGALGEVAAPGDIIAGERLFQLDV